MIEQRQNLIRARNSMDQSTGIPAGSKMVPLEQLEQAKAQFAQQMKFLNQKHDQSSKELNAQILILNQDIKKLNSQNDLLKARSQIREGENEALTVEKKNLTNEVASLKKKLASSEE